MKKNGIMKKIVVLLLSAFLVVGLMACANNGAEEEAPVEVATEREASPGRTRDEVEEEKLEEVEAPEEEAEIEEPEEEQKIEEPEEVGVTADDLVGLWRASSFPDVIPYDFGLLLLNEDGTGIDFGGNASDITLSTPYFIDWAVAGDVLTFVYLEENTVVEMSYRFDGEELILEIVEYGLRFEFYPIEMGSLYGEWTDHTWYTYIFNPDGSGQAIVYEGEDDFEEVFDIEWISDDGMLHMELIDLPGVGLDVYYAVLGDILMMMVAGDVHVYILERVGGGNQANDQGNNQGDAGGDVDIRNPVNYWVELEGVRFAIGQTAGDFAETKFQVPSNQQDTFDGTIAARTVTSLSFEYQTAEGRLAIFSAGLINPTENEIPMRDAIVRTITVDEFTTRVLDDHSFLNDIEIGVTSQEEIIAMFGEPDDVGGTDASPRIIFQSENRGGFSGSSVEFVFSEALDGNLFQVRFTSYDFD